MRDERSAWGMILRGHDLGDAMERLIDRSSRPQPKQSKREAGCANNAPAINSDDQ